MGIRSYFREKKAEAERQQAKAHHWKMVYKAADMAISEIIRDDVKFETGYLYAADVQRVGRENFNLEIEECDAHVAIHARLTFRGYNPKRFAPVWDYDNRTPAPNEPEPCDGYDYVGENQWCRRCGWYLADHPEYIQAGIRTQTEGEK